MSQTPPIASGVGQVCGGMGGRGRNLKGEIGDKKFVQKLQININSTKLKRKKKYPNTKVKNMQLIISACLT